MSVPSSSTYTGPTCWDVTSRSANSRHLQVTGLRVKYTGPGTEDKDAASVRSNHPVPLDCGLFYFEVEVLAKGRDGFIGVGFSTASVKLDRLPGWEASSYGYHGDDGHKFCGSGMGTPYGPTYSEGDTIGVVYNRAERTIAYTKNGIDLGVAFRGVAEEPLFPTVGMRTPQEEVLVHFQPPFKADLAAMGAEARRRVLAAAAAAPLPAKGKVGDLASELLFQALLHHGHWRTAQVVARDVLGGAVQVSEEARQELRARQAIGSAVLAGRVDDAVAATRALAPGCLEASPGLLFRLHCQKFMEMVAGGRVEEALLFARAHFTDEGALSSAEKEHLQDVISLIAYEDPGCSPAGHLLQPSARLQLAGALNNAVLAFQGRPQVSALELLWKQLLAAHAQLRQGNDPAAALVDVGALLAPKPPQQ